MDKNFKKELSLIGLNCVNCAMKIENTVSKINGVSNVTLNFVNQKLNFEIDKKENISQIYLKVKTIISKIEPDVEIKDLEEEFHTKEHQKRFDKIIYLRKPIRITITLIFLIGAFLLSTITPFSLILFILAYLVIGYDILFKSVKNILNGQVFDENFLMSIATLGAFIIGEYPEAVSVLIFYQIGEYFQDKAVNHSRQSITKLMDIKPEYANLDSNGISKKVLPEEINIGDLIIIKPGERVPLDGKVVKGNSMIDSSSLTGESIPKNIKNGDEILSGSINQSGLLTVQVTKEYKDSTVSKILDLVQNASSKKAKTENFITKFAKYYTPSVVVTAIIIAIVPSLFVENSTFTEWIYRALIFLVVSCPCALVISIPLSFFAGIGSASKKGILVKGGNYLEALNYTESVIFDKTGTLTKGIFNVTNIVSIDNTISENDILEYVAYAESHSNHPVAKSILKKYDKQIINKDIDNYFEIPGKGIKATVKGTEITVGNCKLMKKENINFSKIESIGAILYVAINNNYVGYIIIADEVKKGAKKTITKLKNLQIKNIIMLTGDTNAVGKKVSTDLGIDKYYAELLPHEKVEILEKLNNQDSSKGKIIYVGDGINDAPVLARADIGIAMGGLGSDAAIEAADIVIMTDEPNKIVKAIEIAKATKNIVWQNIILALGVKALVLTLGVLGLATMWEAVFADVGVTLIAVLNSIKIMKE